MTGAGPFTAEQRRDMLELLDDRYGQRSTLVTSQMPVDNWHELIGDPTLADAILDRLVHNAYRINLKGESMRKRVKKLTAPPQTNNYPCVACSDCPGRMAVEQVARWPWNAWPDERGLRAGWWESAECQSGRDIFGDVTLIMSVGDKGPASSKTFSQCEG